MQRKGELRSQSGPEILQPRPPQEGPLRGTPRGWRDNGFQSTEITFLNPVAAYFRNHLILLFSLSTEGKKQIQESFFKTLQDEQGRALLPREGPLLHRCLRRSCAWSRSRAEALPFFSNLERPPPAPNTGGPSPLGLAAPTPRPQRRPSYSPEFSLPPKRKQTLPFQKKIHFCFVLFSQQKTFRRLNFGFVPACSRSLSVHSLTLSTPWDLWRGLK